mgnify:CR=1 FL=1
MKLKIFYKIPSLKVIILLLSGFTPTLLFSQVTVKGVVMDAQREPLIGANIIEKGTSNGTVTDIDGNFTLNVRNANSILTFSYIGFITKEVKATSSRLEIILESDVQMMEEVIVVGYGSQKKESVVGSISTLSSADLVQSGTSNLTTAFAGKVPGLTFTIPSGRPGGDAADIYIRGVSTLSQANSKPLILVDGVEREFSQVAPEDIEQFSVLKDASATAVYGVRGANGVILITTKRGQKGVAKVSLNYKYSVQQPTRLPTFVGSYDHAVLRNESLINDGLTPTYTEEDLQHFINKDAPYTHPDNDYFKDFLKEYSPMHDAVLSVRGGTEAVNYYISLNGLFQDGMYKQFKGRYPSNANFKKINFRTNLDFAVTKSTDVSVDLNARLTQEQNVSGGIDNNNIFVKLYETPPFAYPYLLADGSYGGNANLSDDNLLATLTEYGYSRLSDNILEITTRANQRLDFITKGLSARAFLSYNNYYESGTNIYYRPPTFAYVGAYTGENTPKVLVQEEAGPTRSDVQGGGARLRNNLELGLNYSRTFSDHNVTGMLVYTQTQFMANSTLPVGFIGYAGRATYEYKQRYLAEANFGYNGSDQFEKGQRFGFFPSFSLGYILTEEDFMKKSSDILSFLKFRGSYGKVGNDKIGSNRFLFLQTFDRNGNYYFGTDAAFGGMTALIEGALGNDQVTWEVGHKYNAGVDARFFKNLSVTFDIFQENREKIFIQRVSTPQTLGVGSANENIGKVRNRGFELEMGYNGKIGKDFSYNIKGMYSIANNTIIYIDEVPPKYAYLSRIGKSVGQLFGHTVERFYLPDDFDYDADGKLIGLKAELPQVTLPVQPGDFKYLDLNDDGTIDSFDRGPIGNSTLPKFVYNTSLGLTYKNFNFYIFWQGAGGNNKMLSGSAIYEPRREKGRFLDVHMYRWTEERWKNGEKILYPRLASNENQYTRQNNTFFMRKGDYLRLKNVEVSYTFKKSKFLNLNSTRVYIGGTNLLTFDYIKNFDPEMGKLDGFFYPQSKTWRLGVDINF